MIGEFGDLIPEEGISDINALNEKLKEFFNDKATKNGFEVTNINAIEETDQNHIKITYTFVKYGITVEGTNTDIPGFSSIEKPSLIK
ncbi:hypothetical protein [Mycoplasmoides pirum]|uniref:hypothetical protein n=1 Tax=Mycoplasmoides pirum TaxID=2122 RepID=UPI00047FBC2D|nr:hypothetical protein [Mycoplasmoides pirum]